MHEELKAIPYPRTDVQTVAKGLNLAALLGYSESVTGPVSEGYVEKST